VGALAGDLLIPENENGTEVEKLGFGDGIFKSSVCPNIGTKVVIICGTFPSVFPFPVFFTELFSDVEESECLCFFFTEWSDFLRGTFRLGSSDGFFSLDVFVLGVFSGMACFGEFRSWPLVFRGLDTFSEDDPLGPECVAAFRTTFLPRELTVCWDPVLISSVKLGGELPPAASNFPPADLGDKVGVVALVSATFSSFFCEVFVQCLQTLSRYLSFDSQPEHLFAK